MSESVAFVLDTVLVYDCGALGWTEKKGIAYMEISTVDVAKKPTLEKIVPVARRLSVHDKLVLIQMLADELLKEELPSPLKHIRSIEMWTPYNTFGAAQVLAQELIETSDETPESKVDHAIPILGSQLVAG